MELHSRTVLSDRVKQVAHDEVDFLHRPLNVSTECSKHTYKFIYIKNQRDATWQYVY
jgi:hypothetical protein